MPDFNASKDRLILLLVVMELVTWSECSLTIWKVPRPLKVVLKWLCLCCINGTIKSVYTSVYILVYWIVNPLLRTTTQKEKKEKKKIPFKILLFIDNAPLHPRVMYKWYWGTVRPVFSCLLTQHQFCSSPGHGLSNFYFSVLYLRIYFVKAIAATHNDFSDGSRQNLLDSILDAIINLHYSWKEVKISTITRVWKLIPPFMYGFEGFKTPEK